MDNDIRVFVLREVAVAVYYRVRSDGKRIGRSRVAVREPWQDLSVHLRRVKEVRAWK